MTIDDAIELVEVARLGYICDPQECGLNKGESICKCMKCEETHKALATAVKALKLAEDVIDMAFDEYDTDQSDAEYMCRRLYYHGFVEKNGDRWAVKENL